MKHIKNEDRRLLHREVFAFLPGIRYNTNTLDTNPIG
jgi:hypothetical protein